MAHVALLGTGGIGTALGRRALAGGHRLTVWNRTADRLRPLLHAGAEAAQSAPVAVRGAGIVVAALADDRADDLVLGDGAVLAALGENACVIDTATVAPETSRRLAARFGADRFVALPVFGQPPAVEAGRARYLEAGTGAARERAVPFVTSLGGEVTVVGDDPGQALALKILSNALLLGGLALLGEVVALGEKSGVDPGQLREFLTASPMVPPGLADRLDAVLAHRPAGWFPVHLGRKDLRLALGLAGEDEAGSAHASGGRDLRLRILSAADAAYDAIESGHGGDDISVVVEAPLLDSGLWHSTRS